VTTLRDEGTVAERRGDTRERIQQVALELFAERGYDQTSLREVADRLDITRPALYYHFKTKDAILTSVYDDLNASVDDLLSWAAARPRTPEARVEILRRVGDLVQDQWRPLMRFVQANQAAMRRHPIGERMESRMTQIFSVLVDPTAPPVERFEHRLAIVALMLGGVPQLFDPSTPEEDRSVIAMRVATKLLRTRSDPGRAE
jgi:AcrR family transcriptional regulator